MYCILKILNNNALFSKKKKTAEVKEFFWEKGLDLEKRQETG